MNRLIAYACVHCVIVSIINTAIHRTGVSQKPIRLGLFATEHKIGKSFAEFFAEEAIDYWVDTTVRGTQPLGNRHQDLIDQIEFH